MNFTMNPNDVSLRDFLVESLPGCRFSYDAIALARTNPDMRMILDGGPGGNIKLDENRSEIFRLDSADTDIDQVSTEVRRYYLGCGYRVTQLPGHCTYPGVALLTVRRDLERVDVVITIVGTGITVNAAITGH